MRKAGFLPFYFLHPGRQTAVSCSPIVPHRGEVGRPIEPAAERAPHRPACSELVLPACKSAGPGCCETPAMPRKQLQVPCVQRSVAGLAPPDAKERLPWARPVAAIQRLLQDSQPRWKEGDHASEAAALELGLESQHSLSPAVALLTEGHCGAPAERAPKAV